MITAQNSKKNRQNQYTGMLVHTRKKKQDLIVPLLQVPVRQFWFRPMASTNKHSSLLYSSSRERMNEPITMNYINLKVYRKISSYQNVPSSLDDIRYFHLMSQHNFDYSISSR